MPNALTYQTIKHNSQKTVRKALHRKQSKELKEHSAQGTNVPKNLTELKKTVRKALT